MMDFPIEFQKSDYRGYGLATVFVLYVPPERRLLQHWSWQCYDTAPRYPRVRKLVRFWLDEIEGTLHSVTVGLRPLVAGEEYDWLRRARNMRQLN
jgi:uncharacterized protein Usg